jgi:basic membrane protein A
MRKLRRSATRFSTLLHIASVACLACSRADRPPASDTTAEMRVALLTPGPISDQSWNSGAYQGLMRIRDSLGARVSHVQTKTPADFDENFRQYGAQGYSLVIGHGFEFQDAARRVAPLYPRTVYIVSSSEVVQEPNVAGVKFAFADASYLAGLAAGYLTRSGVIGAIGGTELPPVRESFAAFARGAGDANPRARIVIAYVGNWDDVSAGREHALAQMAQGVDVIFQNADAAGLGVIQAARENGRILVIGSNANQNGVAPEVVVGSVVIDLPHAFLGIAREVREGRFTARPIALGTESRVVTLVLNPALEGRLPAPARAHLDSLQREILAGRSPIPPGSLPGR